jgi:uncharacterized protein (DUF1499 family)
MASLKSARTWSLIVFGVALCLLAATAYAIAGSRNGLVGYREAFGALRWIGQIGAATLLAAIVALLVSLKSRSGGTLYASVAAILMALMVGAMVLNEAAPPPGPLMNDITTDLDDPPRFNAVIPLRAPNDNPIEYAETAANQRQVHPEVQAIETALAPPAAYARALQIAQSMGWDIVAADQAAGTIEAVDTTPFFRFKDDVVIRIRAAQMGSRVDLRSHSRVGRSDLGKNAARIMQYRDAFLAD